MFLDNFIHKTDVYIFESLVKAKSTILSASVRFIWYPGDTSRKLPISKQTCDVFQIMSNRTLEWTRNILRVLMFYIIVNSLFCLDLTEGFHFPVCGQRHLSSFISYLLCKTFTNKSTQITSEEQTWDGQLYRKTRLVD